MPELPEVETIRRQLAPKLEGCTLESLEILDPRWCSPLSTSETANAVIGRRITTLSRRGKYFIVELSDEIFLIVHLRMTGTLLYDPVLPVPHSRVRFTLDDGNVLLFVDPRRFGTGQLVFGLSSLDDFFKRRLGVEPFDRDFTQEHLRAITNTSRSPIKPFLLDQHRIAGIGNIYADEALFRARIHPLRPANRLTFSQVRVLHQAVIDSLQAGIDANGATIDDFRGIDGARGSFQNEFLIHRREGQPCLACGTAVIKMTVGGRGTYVCESCQTRPRAKRLSPQAAR